MLLRALSRRGRSLWQVAPRGLLAVEALTATATATVAPLAHAAAATAALAAHGRSPALALTYFAAARVRRVAIGASGPRPQWERRIGSGGAVLGRVGGAALCETETMLVALRLTTGEEKWRLTGHGPLASASALPDGDLLVEFSSGEWLRLRAVSGRRRDQGDRARDARRLAALRDAARRLACPGTDGAPLDHARLEPDGEALIVRVAGQPALRIEPDGTLRVDDRRLGRL